MSATKPFQLHLTEEQLARYKNTAHARRTNLSALIRALMDAESEAVGERAEVRAPEPKKSPFAKPELPEHHEEIMKVLKGLPRAEYLRRWNIPDPETGLMPPPAPPVVMDESESKEDRREREAMERRGVA